MPCHTIAIVGIFIQVTLHQIAMTATVFHEIRLSKQDVLKCLFGHWYPKLKQYSPPATIIPVPRDFREFLALESIRLPNDQPKVEEVSSDDEQFVYSDEFLNFYGKINQSIAEYPFPKLNWLAPKDARWINSNTLRCFNGDEVLLLLKLSDHIGDDLDSPFSEVNTGETQTADVPYALVLKKWVEINPLVEFRVFIRHGDILGASQRDLNHYPHLVNERELKWTQIEQFVNKVLPELDFDLLILDIYVPPNQDPLVVDVNPFSRKLSPLLYTWHELLEGGDNTLRVVDENNVGRFKTMEYSELMVPLDVVGAAHDAGQMAELAREWRQLEQRLNQPTSNQ